VSTFYDGKLRIYFGATCDSLVKQINDLGLTIATPNRMDTLQKYSDAITLLLIHQVLTEGEAHKARGRLMKKIRSAVYYELQGKSPAPQHGPQS
jgi:hypothetical protein